MSDLSTHQHDVTNEELSRIADAVEALVDLLRDQHERTERTVLLTATDESTGPRP